VWQDARHKNEKFNAFGLSGGENLLTAAYGGDNSNTASTSTTVPQNVSLVQITTPLPLLNGLVGTPYSVTLSAAGGTPPYTWQLIGSLPQGLSWDAGAAPTVFPLPAGFTKTSETVNGPGFVSIV
jgi:hypothetical protein